MIVGYARVSTTDQNLEVQLDELNAHGCERIFTDKATGTNTISEPIQVKAMNSVSSAGVCQPCINADTVSSHVGCRQAPSGQVSLAPASKTNAVATPSKPAMASREVVLFSTASTRWRHLGGLWEGRFMASHFQ